MCISFYEGIMQGLTEAIAYERGNLPHVRVDKVAIATLPRYTPDEIKEIRLRHRMTQKMFALACGVSHKTVEAWESGKNPPSGCASRMLGLLDMDDQLFEKYSVLVRK